jgi:hypothetical protein
MLVTFITSTFNPATVIQKNAIYSWKKQTIPFILAGDSDIEGTKVKVLTEKDLGFSGDSPIIPDMIKKSLQNINTEMVALVNADILIDGGFIPNLEKIVDKYGKDIFLTSVRRDTDWDQPIYFDSELEQALHSQFTWHQDASADMFLSSKEKFKKFSEEFPGFIYGRLAWDNAVHVYFRSLGIPCFNTSNFLRLYHQKHGYEHFSSGDFTKIQRNPGSHPSTNHNCHTFGNFMNKMRVGMSDIPRVKSSFSQPEISLDL